MFVVLNCTCFSEVIDEINQIDLSFVFQVLFRRYGWNKSMFSSPRYRFLASKFNFDDYSSKGSVVHPVKKHHRVLAAGSPYAIEGPEGDGEENKQLAISNCSFPILLASAIFFYRNFKMDEKEF